MLADPSPGSAQTYVRRLPSTHFSLTAELIGFSGAEHERSAEKVMFNISEHGTSHDFEKQIAENKDNVQQTLPPIVSNLKKASSSNRNVLRKVQTAPRKIAGRVSFVSLIFRNLFQVVGA